MCEVLEIVKRIDRESSLGFGELSSIERIVHKIGGTWSLVEVEATVVCVLHCVLMLTWTVFAFSPSNSLHPAIFRYSRFRLRVGMLQSQCQARPLPRFCVIVFLNRGREVGAAYERQPASTAIRAGANQERGGKRPSGDISEILFRLEEEGPLA